MFGTYLTLLALMVVFTHLGGVSEIGGYAVFGFFTLSGYLMTLIMQTNYGYTLSGILKYAINRFLRIYPIYWVAIAFSTVLILFVGESFSSNYHGSMYLPNDITEIAKNIFLFFPFRESPRLSPPVWALTVEIFFYILIGLGISKNKKYVLSWLALSVIYHVVVISKGLGGEYRYYPISAASLPFATGALIYHYKREFISYIGRIAGNTKEYLPALVFMGILINWYVGGLTAFRGAFFYSNFILCALMVVVLSEQKTLPYISKKFDKWMGDFSYPIYLIHYQIGLIVIVLLGVAGHEYERQSFIVLFVSIPFIFFFSWIFTIAIEKPIELIRTRVKKKEI